MRALLVVVHDVLAEDSLEVTFAQDQDVIWALPPCGSHESFGEGVHLRRAYGGADDPHALRVRHLIGRPRILGVAVMDQELDSGQAAFDRQVAGLLGNPGGIGMSGDARQVHPAGGELTEEENRRASSATRSSQEKKSQATIPAACSERNSLQEGPSRRGAGRSPWRRSSEQMAVAEMGMPSFFISP